MLQEKYQVYISIKKEWFYKVPESVETAGARLFEGIGLTSDDYNDDAPLWTHYDKMVNGSDIPKIMSNYENFPLYGKASLAQIAMSIGNSRSSEKPTESTSNSWTVASEDVALANLVNKVKKPEDNSL